MVNWREGSSPWGRSGPTTPATVNRSRRELGKERGRKALGRGAVRYQNGPRKAECQVRYGGDGMRRDGRGLDGWNDDLGADDAGASVIERVQNGAAKSVIRPAGGFLAQIGLRNDSCANQMGYQ